jgi:hypothetical protein
MEAFGSPIAAAAIAPPFNMSDGFTPKNAGFHSTRSGELARLDRAHRRARCRARSRVDRVLGDVAPDAGSCRARGVGRELAALLLSSCAPSATCG